MIQKEKLILIDSPGEILKKEFLIPYKLSAYKISKATGILGSSLSKILKGNRDITVEVSARLGKALGMSNTFFYNLQINYNKRIFERNMSKEINNIKQLLVGL